MIKPSENDARPCADDGREAYHIRGRSGAARAGVYQTLYVPSPVFEKILGQCNVAQFAPCTRFALGHPVECKKAIFSNEAACLSIGVSIHVRSSSSVEKPTPRF